MNYILAFLGKYIQPLEHYGYAFLGLTTANGFGVASTSVSTSALIAAFPAVTKLIVDVVKDIHDSYALLLADLNQIKADVPAAQAEVPTSTAGLLAKVESVVAAAEQLPGA